MGRALVWSGEEEIEATRLQNHCFKGFARSFRDLEFWVPKNLGKFCWAHRAGLCKSFSSSSSSCRCCNEKRVFELYNGNVLNNSVFFDNFSHRFLDQEEGGEEEMESLGEITEEGFCEEVNLGDNDNANVDGIVETFGGLMAEKGRESSSSSDFLTSETNEERSHCSCSEESQSSSPTTLGWTVEKSEVQDCSSCGDSTKKSLEDDRNLEKQGSEISEMEMMKERFSKLLLGEDMSGSGNGVSTALSISNAITNLCATIFGQLWRLEPLPQEKKLMWRREMEWLVCVSDHIVELTPSWQTFPDGTKLEIMTCRPRADLYVNLPALRKLDNMLLEILDGFGRTEFWYVDQGIMAPDADGASSLRRTVQRQVDKWWLPVPRVPPGGLHEDTRKQLQHKRDCTNQILKAAMAINSISLADMKVPDSYMESLPKNGRVCLGDITYRYISSEQFYPDCLLDCLDLSSEHQAVELANRVESSIYMWRRKVNSKPLGNNAAKSNSRTSWEIVKDLMVDAEKRELLAERAESLMLCLRQRFPGLPQTALDMSKIQYNKDVGKSILESYSRVLESLAFNIVARIDDLLYVDDLSKRTADQNSPPPVSKFGLLSKTGGAPIPVPIPTTPYKTAFTTPSFSPARPAITHGTGSEISRRGSGAKKVLTDFLSIDAKVNGQQLASTGQIEDKD